MLLAVGLPALVERKVPAPSDLRKPARHSPPKGSKLDANGTR